MSEHRSRKRKRSACWVDSDDSSDSSDSPFEPDRNRRKRIHNDSRSHSSVTDCPLDAPPAGVRQVLRNDSSGYESETEDRDAEYVTTGQGEVISRYESTDSFIAESCGKSDCKGSQETGSSGESFTSHFQRGIASINEQRRRSSDESDDSSRQPCTPSTSEIERDSSGGSGASARQPGAASTTETAHSSEERSDSSRQSNAACITEETGKGTREVYKSPHQLGAASKTEGKEGRKVEVGTSPLLPGAAFTTEEKGEIEEVDSSPFPSGAAYTNEEGEGKSEEVSTSPHQSGAASTADVGGSATQSTSSAAVLPASDVVGMEDSERCPICLVTFTDQEIGIPEFCEHIFCFGCLEEWSKNVNKCPVDRQVFNVIRVRRYSDSNIIRRIPVRPRPRRNQRGRIVLLDEGYCQVCGESDRGHSMIMCNACRLVYHVECLIPLLHVIPIVEWLCPVCIVISSMFYRHNTMRPGDRM